MGYNPWGRKELDMTWWLNNKRHINTSLVNTLFKYFQMLLKSKLKRHCFEIWLRKFQRFTRWMACCARIFPVIPWLHPLLWMEHWGLHLPGVLVSWLPGRCGHWVTLVEKCKVSRGSSLTFSQVEQSKLPYFQSFELISPDFMMLTLCNCLNIMCMLTLTFFLFSFFF